ncbi:MAG: type VI secretion system contractile sheath large subunit, partial [Novosphingobium sp.]
MASEPLKQAGTAAGTEFAPDDFAALLQKEFKPNDDARAARIEQAVATLAQQALADANIVGDDVFTTLDAMRSALDRKLTDQVNTIIHHPDFQRLESAWRGLNYMVMNTSTGKDLKIRVLNIAKDETRKMLRQYRDAAWDQSPLFKKIYESEFGQLGGQPYGAFVCDYSFDHSAPDIEVMKGLSKIGAAAHAPFIAGAAPGLMGMESWQELSNPRDLGKLFDAMDYAAWRSFRDSPDSRYLALTMPRFLGRQVYGA